MARSGIGYDAVLDWAFAAQWWGYKWEEFCDLDGTDQSRLVAVYRTHNQIEGVIQKDVLRRSKAT